MTLLYIFLAATYIGIAFVFFVMSYATPPPPKNAVRPVIIALCWLPITLMLMVGHLISILRNRS